jgi:hypothetical protein
MNLEIDKKAVLTELQKGAELEFATIPLYMSALMSIKPQTNAVSAALIRSVMMEEMLHLINVCNLMTSLGGKVSLTGAAVPIYPLAIEFEGQSAKDRELHIQLLPFSEEAITLFMQIEQPSGWSDKTNNIVAPNLVIDGFTIGDFYHHIETMLIAMVEKYGETSVFSGRLQDQIDQNYYWGGGGKPVVVNGLALAKFAIAEIVEQGEGATVDGSVSVLDNDAKYFDQPEEVAHFYKFREIYFAQYYQPNDDPADNPTGAKFDVDYNDVYPIIHNPTIDDYKNDPDLLVKINQFNQLYSAMLIKLEQGFTGSPEILYTAIVNDMQGIYALGQDIVATPIKNDPQGRHGLPTFTWVET